MGKHNPKSGAGTIIKSETFNVPPATPKTPTAPITEPTAPKTVDAETVAPKLADAGTPKTIAPKPIAPKPAPVAPTAPKPAPAPEKLKIPKVEGVTDLIDRARQSGFDEVKLQSGIDAFESGYMDRDDFQKWMDRVLKPEDAIKAAEDKTSGDVTVDDEPIATTIPEGSKADEDAVKEAGDDYEKTMSDLKDTFKESQKALTQSATDKYDAQVTNLDAALLLHQELAAKQQALIATSTGIQKQEALNAYEANKAAIELQKKKVAEAYESMKIEQKLLNTQRKVRKETSTGLIYGGFGSVAANKNLEETIIRGERTLMGLSKDAINADTELQNKAIAINKAYELDVRKIEQWKAESSGKVYADLSRYVASITADKNMAVTEKDASIRLAITNYNTKVAEISATTAEARLNLSLAMQSRADQLKQQDFQNKITSAEEERRVSEFEYNEKRTVINDSRADLDLILTTYISQDYDTLPADVLAKIKQLEIDASLPAGAGREIIEEAKKNELKQGEIVKEYTNSITGEVTAIRYNFDTGKVETMKLGVLSGAKPPQVWTKVGTDEDGNIVSMNEVTGEVRTQGQFSGPSGTPADAYSIPDGSQGGQCGRFVNQYTGIGVGDSYASKQNKMDPTITKPGPGMVFTMPYRDTGHIGFIVSVNEETGMATVKDSNWFINSAPEAVRTHEIPISQMTGFLDVSGKAPGGTPTETPTETPVQEEPTETTDRGYTTIFTD